MRAEGGYCWFSRSFITRQDMAFAGFAGCTKPAAHAPRETEMQTLLTVLVAWMAANIELPVTYEHPRVEIVSAAKMAEVRYSRLASVSPDRFPAEAGRSAAIDIGRDVYAIYDDLSKTIYLPEGWTAASPAHASVLVHELVHHQQNAGGMKFDCPQEREAPAYRAQARWLELFGKTLADEFEIDAMTVLVRSRCMH
jgi:hypothetical protein